MDDPNSVHKTESDGRRSDEELEETVRSIKRRRTSKGKAAQIANPKGYRGRNVGKLSKLLEMPVDIFCEISSHLEPIDLLQLARSTKGLNKMLMSRDSRLIWRTARQSCPDLPDCPPDLSEPEYARLVFERDCHVCLATRVMKVDWAMRARICHRCRGYQIVKGSQLLKEIPGLTEELLECLPCRFTQARLAGTRRRKLEFFCRNRVERMVAKFRAIVPENVPKPNTQGAKDFYEYYKGLLPVIHKNADDIEHWLALEHRSKRKSGIEASNRRQIEIYSKLEELGHDAADFPYEWNPDWRSLVYQPRALTPRIWTAILPRLEAAIATRKAQRENEARRQRKSDRTGELRHYVQEFLKQQKDINAPLSFSEEDLLTLPAADSLLATDDYGKEITEEAWIAMKEQFEKETKDFYDRVLKEVKGLIMSTRESDNFKTGEGDAGSSTKISLPDVEDAYLFVFTTRFQCTSCTVTTSFKWILNHTHLWRDQPNSSLGFVFSPEMTAIAEAIFTSNPSLEADTQDTNEDPLEETKYMCGCCYDLAMPLMGFSELLNHFVWENKWYTAALAKHTTGETFLNTHDISNPNPDKPLAKLLRLHEIFEKIAKNKCGFRNLRDYDTCRICDWGGDGKKGEEIDWHMEHCHNIQAPPRESVNRQSERDNDVRSGGDWGSHVENWENYAAFDVMDLDGRDTNSEIDTDNSGYFCA